MPQRRIIDNPGDTSARFDVAIVGAGPAGACAAHRMATGGMRVALFDHSHPREKPCGGGLTGRALDLVGGRGLLESLPAITIDGARFAAPGLPEVVVALERAHRSETPPLVVASRKAFDAALVRAAVEAGVTLVPERVVDVSVGRGGVEIVTAHATHRVPMVVGADGANSLVRRRVRRAFDRTQLSIATGFYVDGVSASDILVSFTSDPPGYAWSFPRPGHLAVGVCAEAGQTGVAPLQRWAGAWLDASAIASTAPRRRYSWPIPSLDPASLDREEPAGDRWMLLGDAAGLVDPITREGIYFALRSGELAAAALMDRPGREGAAYAERIRDEMHAELRRAARLRRRFFRPAFIRLLHRSLQESGSIRTVMADLVSGRQTYHGLRRRLLATLEVGLAWRLFRLG